MSSPLLSVLDQSPVSEGMSGGDALRHSIELGQLVDRLGYTRYWVAEHHGTRMLAGASPEILIGPIAAASRRIRVGSGGVMLPHYSPFKVAENFSLLSALYPGRIDLAVGRAAGTDPLTAYVLQRDRRHPAPDDFSTQLAELLAYVRDGLPSAHRFARVGQLPGDPERPQPWLLGSSPQSAVWAAELGLPYAFADFIAPTGADAARRYRATFTPSIAQPQPYTMVAVWALAADSSEEAEYLASSARMAFANFLQGRPILVPPPDRAVMFLREHPELGDEVTRRRRSIIGDAVSVRTQIAQVMAEYQADEAMVVTITADPQARRRSYELLAPTE